MHTLFFVYVFTSVTSVCYFSKTLFSLPNLQLYCLANAILFLKCKCKKILFRYRDKKPQTAVRMIKCKRKGRKALRRFYFWRRASKLCQNSVFVQKNQRWGLRILRNRGTNHGTSGTLINRKLLLVPQYPYIFFYFQVGSAISVWI